MLDLLRFLDVEYEVGDFSEPPQRQYAEVRGPLARFLFGNRVVSRAAEVLILFRLRKSVRNALFVKAVPKPQMDSESRAFLVRYYLDGRRPPGEPARPASAMA